MTPNLPPTRFDAPALPTNVAWLPPLTAITDVVDLNGKATPCCSVVDGRDQWIATMIPVQFHDMAILFAASPDLLTLLKEAFNVLEDVKTPRAIALRQVIHEELWGKARRPQ
jgi:hypothetical protein